MQANLAEAGITLKIDTPDIAQFVEGAFGGGYDLICVEDPAIRTPASVTPFLQNLNVEGPGMVIGGPKWTTHEFDSAITALISEADTEKVAELATKLDENGNRSDSLFQPVFGDEIKRICKRSERI